MKPRYTISQLQQLKTLGTIRGFELDTKTGEDYSHQTGKNIQPKKKSKYNNQKTEVDGILFDSKKEAARFGELKLLLKAGIIGLLERQVTYELGNIARYIADFRYIDVKTGETIVEDVKGVKTPVYKLKKKMMKSMYGITIKEV